MVLEQKGIIMTQYFDINDKELKDGDVIDIHQTVNGQNLFVVLKVEPLNIRYYFDMSYDYEYDKEGLLQPAKFTDQVGFEIVSNIYVEMRKNEGYSF